MKLKSMMALLLVISLMAALLTACADSALKAAAGTYVGQYVKLVGDDAKKNEQFSLTLLEDGYHFMPYTSPALFSSASVRMENDRTVRIHAATDQALYEVLLPRALSAETSNICRALQLYAAETHE